MAPSRCARRCPLEVSGLAPGDACDTDRARRRFHPRPGRLPRGGVALPGIIAVRIMQETVCLVVPCYNERNRLAMDRFAEFSPALQLLFVDDGSTDGTGDFLRAAQAGRVAVPAARRESRKSRGGSGRHAGSLPRRRGRLDRLLGRRPGDAVERGRQLPRLPELSPGAG